MEKQQQERQQQQQGQQRVHPGQQGRPQQQDRGPYVDDDYMNVQGRGRGNFLNVQDYLQQQEQSGQGPQWPLWGKGSTGGRQG